jgi:hypothetical protein
VGELTAGDYATSLFTRLGHTGFDPNQRSGHRAREVKKVHVDTTAHFLKLLFHQPHANGLNPAQQVALARGDTVILTENDSNDSKISM